MNPIDRLFGTGGFVSSRMAESMAVISHAASTTKMSGITNATVSEVGMCSSSQTPGRQLPAT